MAQQTSDLEAARATELQMGELAAQLGCIGNEGQLLRERLQTVTTELLQARESEATYQGWLDDVKRMVTTAWDSNEHHETAEAPLPPTGDWGFSISIS